MVLIQHVLRGRLARCERSDRLVEKRHYPNRGPEQLCSMGSYRIVSLIAANRKAEPWQHAQPYRGLNVPCALTLWRMVRAKYRL
jgi:hypothetical protein